MLPKIIKHSDETIMTLILAVFLVGAFTLIRMFKYYNECQAIDQANKIQYLKYFTHGALSAVVSVGVSIAILKMSESDIITMIPIIGIPFSIINMINSLIPGASTALVMTMAHFICNLNENMSENIKPICSSGGFY
jgi:hypothetical protein